MMTSEMNCTDIYIALLGNLSNDDEDGNDNAAKQKV